MFKPMPVCRFGFWAAAIALVFALALGTTDAAASPKADRPEPAKTWVFAVSSLVWKYDHGLNMPKKGREDIDFVRVFQNYGVPADHIVFLKDRQGTLKQINARFTELLEKTQSGGTLLFYFQRPWGT
ncbi:MAG TPA: hypothetical protein VKU00_32550 [Chthonomonadaceae bacterium]|nr:hypothetical protein [Chthonomonadaceae bacterium]